MFGWRTRNGPDGHALAERLLGGGHTLTIWNRTSDKADDPLVRGVRQPAMPRRRRRAVSGL